MRPCRAILVSALLFLIGADRGSAQDQPQSVIAEKGNWKLTLPAAINAAQDKFALSTRAIDQDDTSFRLSCKRDPQLYYFAIQDVRLAELPLGEEAAIEIRIPNQDSVRFQGGSRGDGSIVIQEVVQQTAFTVVHSWLLQDGASTLGLAVGNYQWMFSLDGFAALMDLLVERCGDGPNPTRTLRRGR
jgi:hypothetical protein